MKNRLDRRSFLATAGFAMGAAVMPSTLLAAPATAPQEFTFIFFTDTHTEPELDATKGTAMALRKARTLKADFAIQGGDMVFDAAAVPKERSVKLFDLYHQTEQELGMKVYHTIGNHDVLGMGTDAVSQTEPMYGKKMFEDRYGKTYYSFDHKGYHFVVLDSIEYHPDHLFIGHINQEQVDWLAADLKSVPPGTPTIVISHIPLVTGALAYFGQDMTTAVPNYASLLTVQNAHDVLATFEGHNIIGAFQGHTHINELVLWKDVPYRTSGAVCGNWWRGAHLGIPEGFTVVNVAGGKVTTHYETYGFTSVAPTAGMGYK
jgi:Icc protein